MTLDDGNRFYIHLGMTGRLTLEDAEQTAPVHTHLMIGLREPGTASKTGGPSWQLRFTDPRRFGGVWWLGTDDGADGMGPEPLTLTSRQLAERLSGTTRAIKTRRFGSIRGGRAGEYLRG